MNLLLFLPRFLPRLKAQIIKEILSFVRDPKTRMILIIPPLMQLLVFSFAATLEIKNATIALLNQDNGAYSSEFIQHLAAASFVGKILYVKDSKALQQTIEARQAILAIEIPATFSPKILAGESAPLQVIVDGRRANGGQIALAYVQSVATNLALDLKTHELAAQTDDILRVRHWFNPNLIYQWFVVPSFAGMLSMVLSLMITALSIARERELGTFNQLLVSPTTASEIIVAKCLPALIIGSSLGMIMVAAGVFLFRIPFHGSFWLLYALMLLFILSVVGIGLMISSVSSTQQQAILGTFAVMVPMILMSGFATPIENMPFVLQRLAEAIPLKHFLIIVQGSFLRGMSASEAWSHAWPLIIIAIITLGLATNFVRNRLQ